MEKATISINHEGNIIELIKEDNIKIRIIGNNKKIYRIDLVKKDGLLDKNAMTHIYGATIFNKWFCSENIAKENYPNIIYIYIVSDNGWMVDIVYDKLKNKFNIINTVKDTKLLFSVRSPIVIVGAPGGGTSFITKIFRNRGLYMGTDCGSLISRKPHESYTFRSLSEIIFIHNGNRLNNHDDGDFKKIKQLVKNNVDLYTEYFRNRLEYKFSSFWGNEPINSIWGWKYPHCSLLIPVLKNIFSEFKLLVIKRNKNKLSKNICDLQGNWFREKASDFLLESYMNPDIDGLEKDRVSYCYFHELVSDREKINDVLNWIGLIPFQSDKEYKIFMKDVGYEG